MIIREDQIEFGWADLVAIVPQGLWAVTDNGVKEDVDKVPISMIFPPA